MKTGIFLSILVSMVLTIVVSVLIPSGACGQWSGDPTVNTAVCKQSDGQDGSCAVSDGQGGVIVAWLDNRDNKRRIYAQRLSPAGIAQWTEDGILICSQDGGKQDLVIIGDGSGGAFVAWQDYRNDADYPATPEGDIFAQYIDAAGSVKWAGIGVPICTAQWNQSFPAAVGDGSGGAIIAWMDGRTGNDHVYAQRISPGGYIQWASDGVPICEQGYYQRYPDIATDGPGGGAIITWQDQRVYDAFDIYAQRINAAGVVQWTKDGVVVCNAGGHQSNPVIVPDGLGGAVIAWDDARNYATTESDIYAQRLNASGQIQWSANGVAICTLTGYQHTPAIAKDGTGGAIITWEGNFDIYAQRIHGNGNTLWTANGVAICTESSQQWFPRIIEDDFNGAVITWEDKRSGNWDIYAMRVSGGGAPQWTTDGLAISRPQNDQAFSIVPPIQHGDNHIVKAGTCGAIVVWNDGRANNGDIYAQRVYCEGTLGGEQIIIDLPNGGESWNVGSTRYIRWHTEEFSGNVNILASYSGYNPQFWLILASNETNDGTFEWVVPNNPSSNCIIKIVDADDGEPYDVSDAVFIITGSGGGSSFIKVDVPNGGENWQIGSQHNIVWHAQNFSGPVKIEYSTDGGANYSVIENSYAGLPPYTWTIPSAVTSSCVVSISDPTDGDPKDISDGVFTISTGGAGTPSITLDIPNGGENWMVDSKHYIVWHAENYTGPVNIEYSIDSGASYNAIESSYSGPSSYEWTIPNLPSTNCVMRIAEPSFYEPMDTSNAVFTISSGSTNNTAEGQNIMVELGGNHTIQFDLVTVEGNTDLAILADWAPPPDGYSLFPAAAPLFYDIFTTAGYEDTVRITLQYDDASLTEDQESLLRIFNFNEDAGDWIPVPTVVDPENNRVMGTVMHLSVFGIMLQDKVEVEEPVSYVVSNTQDSGEGSLRKALSDAYLDTGVVVITFQIPKTDPGFNADTGVWSIRPQSKFQSISDKYIIIDGISQSQFIGEDTNPYGPEIEINGKAAGENAQGLFFYNSSVEITHLIINRFSDAGIYLWKIQHAMIAGCYIGTGPYGFEQAGNYVGIAAMDHCKHINIVPLDTIPNVISGNENGGISFWDTCSHNLVAGNFIGLNRTGREVVAGINGTGVSFLRLCDSNTVVDNWIGGNGNGIGIWECNDNIIAGNRIGTDDEWTIEIMNSYNGVEIGHESERNQIIGNFIGNNILDGIRINDNKAMYNRISENSISMNELKGINLVNGANGGIAAPKITNVFENEIMGTALPMSVIEIFTDSHDEGRIIQAVVPSDPEGNWGWVGPIQGTFDSIRATATDTMGNTSEFGLYRPGEEPTSVSERMNPIYFTLLQNLSGRHSPETQIHFNLDADMDVSLDVYNLSGIKVYEIHKGRLQAGHHSMTWNTSRQTAGVYLIRMQTHRGALTRKCVVLK